MDIPSRTTAVPGGHGGGPAAVGFPLSPHPAMLRPLALACAFGLALSACRTAAPPRPAPAVSSATPAERQLVGMWRMAAVYEGSAEVSATHNPSRNRWIELRADRSFASGGDPYGPNTGSWRYNEDASTLEILSDLGRDDDSVWRVSFRDGEMVWRGVGSARAERFTIIARRGR